MVRTLIASLIVGAGLSSLSLVCERTLLSCGLLYPQHMHAESCFIDGRGAPNAILLYNLRPEIGPPQVVWLWDSFLWNTVIFGVVLAFVLIVLRLEICLVRRKTNGANK